MRKSFYARIMTRRYVDVRVAYTTHESGKYETTYGGWPHQPVNIHSNDNRGGGCSTSYLRVHITSHCHELKSMYSKLILFSLISTVDYALTDM